MFSSTPRAAAVFSGIAALLFTSFATQAFGSSIDTKITEHQQAAATKFVAQKLHTWQDRMNLKDWNIQVQLVRADQLEPKTLGNIHWDTDIKAATIDVLSPLDYKMAYEPMLKDMEFTIVHELVHLELASLPRSDASRRVEERAVNELAGALLRLAN
jgi:hypothetical protein